MPIKIISDIQPVTNARFPVVDITYVKGGYQSVGSLAERNAITLERRSTGMMVHVRDTNRTYRLVGGIFDSFWTTEVASTYEHTQSVSASSWLITHNLGYNPNIFLLDAAGVNINGQISFPTGGVLARVLFNSNITGSGFCS